MRVFAALPLPSAVSRAVDAALAPARRLWPRVRWVAAGGFHLTLHFFGEQQPAAVEAIQRVFDDPALPRAAISARLGAFGQFPARGSPRVLWVGLARGEDQMRELWELLGSRLAPLRVAGGPLASWLPDERGFSPHITLARAGTVTIDSRWQEGLAVPAEDFLVEECVLYQSLLGPGGARYEPLKRVSFSGAAS